MQGLRTAWCHCTDSCNIRSVVQGMCDAWGIIQQTRAVLRLSCREGALLGEVQALALLKL